MIYTIFSEATRLPVGRLSCAPSQLQDQLRPGQIAIEGDHDLYRTRLGDEGQPTAFEPPEEDNARALMRYTRQCQIDELERKHQARILREFILDPTAVGEDGKTPAERLRELDERIAALRATAI